MTPEKLAFIGGQSAPPKPKATKEDSPSDAEQIVDLEERGATELSNNSKGRVSKRRERANEPDAKEILDQLLVPKTIRLQHRTAQALKRASLELRLRHAAMSSEQQIAEEALSQWLTKQGFLE